MSRPATGKNIPLRPPSVKVIRKPRDHIVWDCSFSEPPCRVQIQLNILAPVGTATSIVVTMNRDLQNGDIPDVSMWCPQTTNPTTPIPAIANTMDL